MAILEDPLEDPLEDFKKLLNKKPLNKKPRILIVGSSGVGKSSIIKYLTEKNIKVSDSAVGCSLKCELFEDDTNIYADTVGLNEGQHGTNPSLAALDSITNFLKSNQEGFNLVIFVARKNRITTEFINTYQLFNDIIIKKNVPILLCLTGCENDEPMNKWYPENKEYFDEAGLIFDDVVSVSFAQGGRFEKLYKDLRRESIELVKEKILKLKKNEAVPLYMGRKGLIKLIVQIWNFIIKFFNKDWSLICWDLVTIFIRLGCTKDDAIRRVKKIEFGEDEIEMTRF